MQIICFHNPYEENGYLSNWYPVQFSVDGIDFSSMEQFMMYRKAQCFQDKKIADGVLQKMTLCMRQCIIEMVRSRMKVQLKQRLITQSIKRDRKSHFRSLNIFHR